VPTFIRAYKLHLTVILFCQVILVVLLRKGYPHRYHLYSLLLTEVKISKSEDYNEKQILSMFLHIRMSCDGKFGTD
jgi:hypothetical protein